MLWVVAACWAPIAQLSDAGVVLSPLPLFHSYALNLSVLGILATGATEHIMEKFSVKEAVRLLKAGEFTVLPGVRRCSTTFWKQLGTISTLFPSLRVSMSAGAILPAALGREFEERFGIKLLDGYGITETSTMVTMNGLDGAQVIGHRAVYPLRGVAVRIRFAGVEPGCSGRRGRRAHCSRSQPDERLSQQAGETASPLKNGWYHTGALARSDINGFLTNYRPLEGIDHPRRAEHRARRNRGGRRCVRGRS